MSFTLHLVFSSAGLTTARPLLAPTDRLVCMHDLGNVVAPAGITARVTAEPRGPDHNGDAIPGIDFPTLAAWCAEADRVVSWP